MTDMRIKAILDEALQLRHKGDLHGAVRAIQPLLTLPPRKASVAGIIATIYFESGQWKAAARWFGAASKLNPDAEPASLGLFHSLWELDQRKEAFAEMVRFRSSHLSPEFNALHRELTEEFLQYMAEMNGYAVNSSRKTSRRWRNGAHSRKVSQESK